MLCEKELLPLQSVGSQKCLAFSTDGSRFAMGEEVCNHTVYLIGVSSHVFQLVLFYECMIKRDQVTLISVTFLFLHKVNNRWSIYFFRTFISCEITCKDLSLGMNISCSFWEDFTCKDRCLRRQKEHRMIRTDIFYCCIVAKKA